MGFGLHVGWAIEGAVGSMKKVTAEKHYHSITCHASCMPLLNTQEIHHHSQVDTTYLSPHVNMSARMMTASRQYRVQILATEDFYKVQSPRNIYLLVSSKTM